jgi:hypothetical protein
MNAFTNYTNTIPRYHLSIQSSKSQNTTLSFFDYVDDFVQYLKTSTANQPVIFQRDNYVLDDASAAKSEILKRQSALIIDHTCTKIASIPVSAIINAKSKLHIAFGHTSHGQQILEGLTKLDDFMSGKEYPALTFAVNFSGKALEGQLDIYNAPWKVLKWKEYGRDLGSGTYSDKLIDADYTAWLYTTRKYLGWKCGSGDGSLLSHYASGKPVYNPGACNNCNVILWAWCSQAGYNNRGHIEQYLENLSQLEKDYPEVIFVYMTGHVDGSGLNGTLHINNEIIRKYCKKNNKILYDFEDIESWSPDGNYYGDKFVSEGCNWDANKNGVTEETKESETGWVPSTPLNGDRNWALDWQKTHAKGKDWYECEIDNYHTQHLNTNLKAYSTWWLFAILAGWNGK